MKESKGLIFALFLCFFIPLPLRGEQRAFVLSGYVAPRVQMIENANEIGFVPNEIPFLVELKDEHGKNLPLKMTNQGRFPASENEKEIIHIPNQHRGSRVIITAP